MGNIWQNCGKRKNLHQELNGIGPVSYTHLDVYKRQDLHLLQEVYYNTLKGDRFGLNAWYINSNRELPMLTTDYGDETAFETVSYTHLSRRFSLL